MVEERLRYAIRFLSRHSKDFSLKEWRQINNPNYTKLLTLPKIQLTLDKPNTCYKVNYSDNSSCKSLAAIIADAILKEPEAAQLVARFGGDNLEMEKDWEMMSEFDKDEIIRKKIIREL